MPEVFKCLYRFAPSADKVQDDCLLVLDKWPKFRRGLVCRAAATACLVLTKPRFIFLWLQPCLLLTT